MTLLADGKVMVSGGRKIGTEDIDARVTFNTTEIYDPATGDWTPGSDLLVPRALHTTTLLPNGKVLFVGGKNDTGGIKRVEVVDAVGIER